MRSVLGLGWCLVVASCVSAPPPQPEPKAEPKPVAKGPDLTPPGLRLPDGVKPSGYALSIRIVPGEETVTGEVTIDLALDSARDVIWLNANEIVPGAATFTAGNAKTAAKTVIGDKYHLAVVPERPVGPGAVQLKLAYTAQLSKKNSFGLFQLKDQGESYAYTHFEPIDARRAFPCLDEPQFKVPWQVTLHVKKEHLAFSNTLPTAEVDEPNGMKAVTFARTLPLPSYLVAFAVGPFEVVDAGTWGKNKTAVRIIVPKGESADTKWAVASTGPILEQLEAYFGRPYPYPKLDQISLSTAIGAMENPGLVTSGQGIILAKTEQDTPGRQRGYAGTCAHELAHMWFGDLVTTAFWDDLWLNEAFATWMSGRLLEKWQPTWGADVSRVQRRSGALGLDSLMNARRIRQPIVANDDIRNAFDGITYNKGASVLAMFESFVGEDVFRKGVQRYLGEHEYANATAADFLAAVSKEAGHDVAPAFATFLDQVGGPLVSFKLTCDKGAKPKLELTQKRFLPLGSKADPNQLWQVPVCVRAAAGKKTTRACTVLDGATGTLELPELDKCPDWVLPNDGMRGYYRSSVDGTKGLLALLKKSGDALSIPERVGVFGDANALLASGDGDLKDALDAIPLALKADNRHLTGVALSLAQGMGDDFLPEAQRAKYRAWVLATFGPKAKKLGFEVGAKDDEDNRLLRPWLLWVVGWNGKEPKLRAQADALANKWLTDKKAIHADVVDTALNLAADTNDAVLHDGLLAAARAEPDRLQRNRMVSALGWYRDPKIVSEQIPLVLSKDFDVRDAMPFLYGATAESSTRDLGIAFVTEHFDALVERLPAEAGAGLVGILNGVCDERRRDDGRNFFDGRSTRYLGGPRNFALTLESIDLCIAYRARHRPEAVAFFDSWKPGR